MKTNKLIFLSLIIILGIYNNAVSCTIYPQEQESLNKIDKKGRKQGHWVYFGKDIPSKNYPDLVKVKEGEYDDDRKEGLWVSYYKDGKSPKTEGTYRNNRPTGSYVKYWENGTIREKGVFIQKKYQDSLQRFNDKGILIYEGNYDSEGNENGTVKYYYDNGQLELEYQVEQGIIKGKSIRYWPNGDVKEVQIYNQDGSIMSTEKIAQQTVQIAKKPAPSNIKKAPKIENPPLEFNKNGYNKVYNNNKEIWMDGEFNNGLLWDGILYIYDEDGLLKKVEVYKEGLYHSDGQL
ncbi:MAG: toxin-antitoxin system YwqK family antitoxin [Lishizhenia sp.]